MKKEIKMKEVKCVVCGEVFEARQRSGQLICGLECEKTVEAHIKKVLENMGYKDFTISLGTFSTYGNLSHKKANISFCNLKYEDVFFSCLNTIVEIDVFLDKTYPDVLREKILMVEVEKSIFSSVEHMKKYYPSSFVHAKGDFENFFNDLQKICDKEIRLPRYELDELIYLVSKRNGLRIVSVSHFNRYKEIINIPYLIKETGQRLEKGMKEWTLVKEGEA